MNLSTATPKQVAEFSNHERRTVKERVTDEIRTLILERQLSSGARIIQSEIAEQLGVSRTPVREAIETLISEGLVTFSAYKGASVADFSLAEIEDIYSVRMALETYAGNLAAQRITEAELAHLESLLTLMEAELDNGSGEELMDLNRRFNSTIFAASRQPRLSELAVMYMHQADINRRVHFGDEELAAEVLEEHRELLNALRKGDPEEVETLTRAQVQRSVSAFQEWMTSSR